MLDQLKGPHRADLLGDIRSAFSSFHASEAAIAQTVLNDPAAVSQMKISDLAEHSETSVASIVRFSKAMGFKGYPEFRMALVGEVSRRSAFIHEGHELESGITLDDSATEIIRKITSADALAIQATAERLDLNDFVSTIDAWEQADTIGIVGFASSGYVAMDLQLKLNRFGKHAYSWKDFHTALTSVSMLKKGDVLVAVSHSGKTAEILDVMTQFKKRGVKIVLITNALRSPATQIADYTLFTAARETTFRSGATASRIAQLTVVDCLCVALAQRNWVGTKSAIDESRKAVVNRFGKKGVEVESDSKLTKKEKKGWNQSGSSSERSKQ